MNKTKVKKSSEMGFTMVEVMIAVAIIGLLAAISVPNFKKYSAKSKTVEAKIQLASIYTAQTSFYQLFDMYSNCLGYMGYDPSRDVGQRYYAVGFANLTADINTAAYSSALSDRLVSAECPRSLGEANGESVFVAGKPIGSNVINTIAIFNSVVTNTSNILNESLGPRTAEVHSGLGDQSSFETKVFTAVAAGYIDSSATTPDKASLWTINHKKKLSSFQTGY